MTQLSAWTSEAPWSDALEVEKYLLLPGEVPERVVPTHSIGLRLGPPGLVGMRLGGTRTRSGLARPGDFCLFSAGTTLSGEHQRQSEFLHVGLTPDFVATVADRVASGPGRVEFTNPCSVSDPAVKHIVLALAEEATAGCPAGRIYGESLATALASHLLRHYATKPFGMTACRGGLPPFRLLRVLDYIAAQSAVHIGLRDLAALAQLSPHHFAAAFKQSTGMPPYRYVLHQRMARAKELLAGSRQSLAEVSDTLGFPSQAHFTTMFRKFTGTTPGAYRARR